MQGLFFISVVTNDPFNKFLIAMLVLVRLWMIGYDLRWSPVPQLAAPNQSCSLLTRLMVQPELARMLDSTFVFFHN